MAVTPALADSDPDPPVDAPSLPRAEIYRPSGVDPDLLAGAPDESVRVSIILAEQPVLEETTKPSFETALSGYTRGDLQAAARRSPNEISDVEVEVAAEAEERRDTVTSKVTDELATIEDLAAPVERAVGRAGGDVVPDEASGGPLAVVVAEVDRADLKGLAARREVQAIVAAPKPEPELDTSTSTIAVSPVWAQHNGGADPDGPPGGASDVRTGLTVGMSGDKPQSNPSCLRWDSDRPTGLRLGARMALQQRACSPPATRLTGALRLASPPYEAAPPTITP